MEEELNLMEECDSFFDDMPIPYLQHGDTEIYIDQFLSDSDKKSQTSHELDKDTESYEKDLAPSKKKKIGKGKRFTGQKKRVYKNEVSRCHNQLKHLNNALRTIVKEDNYENSQSLSQRVSAMIWKSYKNSNDQSKKTLVFIFNEEVFNQITPDKLKGCGMLEIYNKWGKSAFQNGLHDLRHWVFAQIHDEAVENYLITRKLKNKEDFVTYFQKFRLEVEAGTLQKRVKI